MKDTQMTRTTQPQLTWVLVTDRQGRRHLESRWTTGRPAHTTPHAA